jgi:hypothetical protein
MFILPKYDVNVTTKRSYNMQRFLIFVVRFANFLHLDIASLVLLMLTHYRPKVEQLR